MKPIDTFPVETEISTAVQQPVPAVTPELITAETFDPANPGFNVREAVGKLPNPWTPILKKVAPRLATLAMVGLLAGGAVNAITQEDYDVASARAAEADEAVLESDYEFDTAVAEVGESCATTMNDYFSGSVLEGTSEDSVVSDLMTNPDQPCGDDPTEIRGNVRIILEADDNLVTEKSNRENLLSTVEARQTNADRPWVEGGLLIGSALGLFWGGYRGREAYPMVRYRRRKRINTEIKKVLQSHWHSEAVADVEKKIKKERKGMHRSDVIYRLNEALTTAILRQARDIDQATVRTRREHFRMDRG